METNTVYEINIMRFKNFIFLLGFFLHFQVFSVLNLSKE